MTDRFLNYGRQLIDESDLDTVPLLDIVKCIEDFIDTHQPEIVLTHHLGDLNIDHKLTHTAVLTAARPLPETTVKSIAVFETPSATEWGEPGSQTFRANVYVDVSTTFEAKLEALHSYDQEMRSFPHPRSYEYVATLAKLRGGESGLNAAEAFQLIRHTI